MFDFFNNDTSDFDRKRATLENTLRELNGLSLPTYKEEFFQRYSPETASYELVGDDVQTKSQQMELLKRLAGLAQTGESDADRAAFDQARRAGAQTARAGADAAMQNAQARGVGGSGLEFAMREMANQGGAERARAGANEQAMNAARQRALYNQAYAQGLQNMRSQNNQIEQGNKNIINQFNQLNTQNRNQGLMYNQEGTRAASRYNNELANQRYGNQRSAILDRAGLRGQLNEVDAAQNERERQRRGALGGLVGAGIGGYFGGSQGAGIGYMAGNGIGGGL